MSKLVNWGLRFSRDCFLCLGGAFFLIAFGSLAGNLPGAVKYGDWPASELREMLSHALWLAVWGATFLVTAYGLFSTKRWGVPLAVVVSILAIVTLFFGSMDEKSDPNGLAVTSIYAAPMTLTLVSTLAAAFRDARQSRVAEDDVGSRNHTA